METFNFPYHRVSDVYPESSVTMKFGGGYQFAMRPRGPDQIRFKLAFNAMWFFTTSAGAADLDRDPLISMWYLQAFYERHRLYEKFIYPHPRRGNIICRFSQPLSIPDGIEAGNGQVQAFNLEFISQP